MQKNLQAFRKFLLKKVIGFLFKHKIDYNRLFSIMNINLTAGSFFYPFLRFLWEGFQKLFALPAHNSQILSLAL